MVGAARTRREQRTIGGGSGGVWGLRDARMTARTARDRHDDDGDRATHDFLSVRTDSAQLGLFSDTRTLPSLGGWTHRRRRDTREDMTHAELDAIMKTLLAKADKDGWTLFPEGSSATLHIAKDGASLTLSRVEGVKVDGAILYARTSKKEMYATLAEDLLAVAFDPGSSQPARRAGF